MALAVILYVCRGVNVVIFSTGSDSSTTLLQMAKDFFFMLPNAMKKITVNRKDMICTLPADIDVATRVPSAAEGRNRFVNNTIMARSGNVVGTLSLSALSLCSLSLLSLSALSLYSLSLSLSLLSLSPLTLHP